ncbi:MULTISPECIES: DM13 domain-containing protein [unclassified Polaribacter]|uniref:T9SS type A sorting domain-containing protein n=1 Tax=unclassified Polaribacter TaxID=196858 RepID=UPI0011BF4ECD|nr:MULTISPECIES: DM13 domain-containing protein [unclassified Polaribacter]TXD54043.1 T9SS type A sorting domain-containing protein [Polaribacter sp. IC063]TXD62559.1 T9SS type A sorting domain-containing protein [Polaribacter sp. IC066]
MKKLLLILLLAFISINIHGQCTETLGEFGNNVKDAPSYNISGDVSISLTSKNQITLSLEENFSTEPGPDVRAFLVSSNGKTKEELTETLIATLNHIDFGLIKPSGKQSLSVTIPDNKDISDFDTVFFYCLQFNHFWDLGTFTKFNASSCSVLDNDTFKIDKISFYPNPAKDKIHFLNMNTSSAEIRIFNVLGKQVFHQKNNTKTTLNISNFSRGIYLVKINMEGKSKTQKLVIQ